MHRSIACRVLAATLLSLLAGCNLTHPSTTTPTDQPDIPLPQHPNIIFIMADDLGWAELGSYGQTKIKTPNLDRLATQGLRFTRAYSGSAVCAPSRSVLLTGKHPGRTPIRDNREVKPEGQAPLPDDEITLAERLKSYGYTTGIFGKWGLGFPGSEGDPTKQGFDRFYGYNCQRQAHSYYPAHLWSDTTQVSLNNTPPVPGHAKLADGADPNDPRSYDIFKGTDYAPDRIHEQALAFIDSNATQPFFLFYATVIPHLALHVPDEHLEPYLAQNWTDPPFTRPRGGYTPHYTPRAAYAAMITRLDTYVGNVLNKLDQLGLTENTLVVFTSDNGTTHLKQEVDYDFFNSVAHLRGLKGSLYEGGVRVPLIVKWPGHTPANATTEFTTGLEDWTPTLLNLVSPTHPKPQELDGHSILPTITGNPQPPRPFLYRELRGYGGQQALWQGPYKAIRRNLMRKTQTTIPPLELYHLEDDPSEKTNLAANHPDLVKKLRTLIDEQHEPSELFPMPLIER